jgi:cell growth-regulating nucleolar protein
MVSFVCNACGQTVRKNQVEKHYQTVCRQCQVLSCIDCGKDFQGEDYAKHTSCISEAEKYQGKLFQPKEKANKGEQKQQEWIKVILDILDFVVVVVVVIQYNTIQ